MSDQARKKVGDHIIRASVFVGIAHASLKLMGLIQARFATQYLTPNEYDVILVTVFQGIIYSIYLIGEESIGPSFLPIFLDARGKDGDKGAWRFANVFLTVQTIILLAVVTLVMCFPDAVVRLLTEWTGEGADEKRQLAARTLFWLAPALFCLSLGSTTYMILNGYKRFFLAAFGDSSWKIFLVISMIGGFAIFHLDYRAVIFGLLVGSIAKLLTHLVGLRGELWQLRASLDLGNPYLRKMMILMLPLLIGIVCAKFRDYYNNVYILTPLKLEGGGLLQANDIGRKLFQTVGWLVPYTVSIVMFPFFCELADRDDKQHLGDLLTESCRMLLVFFIPVAMVIAVLAEPLVFLTFKGGQFTAQSAHYTAISTACYTFALPSYAIEYVLMQGFFANRKMVAISVIGIFFSVLSVVISWLFISKLHYTLGAALAVVSLAYVGTRTLKVIAMIVVLKRTVPMFHGRSTALFLARATLHGLVVGGIVWASYLGLRMVLAGALTRSHSLLFLAVCGVVASLAFWAVAWVLRLDEPFQMVRWAQEKVRARRSKSGGSAA